MRRIKFADKSMRRKCRKTANVILAWLLVFLSLFLIVFAGSKIVIALGESSLRNNAATQMPSLTVDSEPETDVVFQEAGAGNNADTAVWKEGWVRHDGKIYEYNEEILTFLFLGIDKMGKVAPNPDLVSGGQSDAIFLLAANPDTKTLTLIGVNRDTMVDVVMVGVGPDGGNLTAQAEIAVQHGFGDGMEESCELTREAVTKLFYDLPIHGYLSFNMGGIADLNDAMGGVELSVLEDMTKINKKWTEGTTVTLLGKDAYDYIHYRDVTEFESARNRLSRQKQYLSCFVAQTMERVRKDITIPVSLYSKFQPYIVTDLTVDEIAYLATELVDYHFDAEDIYTLEGETRMGESFEEFYPDKEALRDLIIQVFYREVEENTVQ